MTKCRISLLLQHIWAQHYPETKHSTLRKKPAPTMKYNGPNGKEERRLKCSSSCYRPGPYVSFEYDQKLEFSLFKLFATQKHNLTSPKYPKIYDTQLSPWGVSGVIQLHHNARHQISTTAKTYYPIIDFHRSEVVLIQERRSHYQDTRGPKMEGKRGYLRDNQFLCDAIIDTNTKSMVMTRTNPGAQMKDRCA